MSDIKRRRASESEFEMAMSTRVFKKISIQKTGDEVVKTLLGPGTHEPAPQRRVAASESPVL